MGSTAPSIWGSARVGKTSAILYARSELKRKKGDSFPAIIWTVTDHPETERSFYSNFLTALGFTDKKSESAWVLKDRVINALNVMACENPAHKIVLFIDEASKLKEKEFFWLMDIYNNLYLRSVQLTCVLVGNRELHDLKMAFKRKGADQIVGRFMVHEQQYYGLSTNEELAYCLHSLDKVLLHGMPEGQDLYLLDAAFPHRGEMDFYSLTSDYWEAFMAVRAKYNVKAPDIPMQYLTYSYKSLILRYGIIGDTPVVFPTYKEIKNAIEQSGYGGSDDQYEIGKNKTS